MSYWHVRYFYTREFEFELIHGTLPESTKKVENQIAFGYECGYGTVPEHERAWKKRRGTRDQAVRTQPKTRKKGYYARIDMLDMNKTDVDTIRYTCDSEARASIGRESLFPTIDNILI